MKTIAIMSQILNQQDNLDFEHSEQELLKNECPFTILIILLHVICALCRLRWHPCGSALLEASVIGRHTLIVKT